MKVLAIDYGSRRIGLALGDLKHGVAVPFKTLKNDSSLLRSIGEILRNKGIGRVVLGYPLTMRGKEGQRAREVKAFYERLRKSFPDIEILLVDERYSTQEALRRLREIAPGKEEKLKDSYAALVILEDYMWGSAENVVLE